MVIFLGRMVILETSIQRHWKHHTIIQISYNLIIIRKKISFLHVPSIYFDLDASGLQWPSVAFSGLQASHIPCLHFIEGGDSTAPSIRAFPPGKFHKELENSTDDLISEPLADSQSPRSPKSFGNVSRGIGIFALSKFSNAYL